MLPHHVQGFPVSPCLDMSVHVFKEGERDGERGRSKKEECKPFWHQTAAKLYSENCFQNTLCFAVSTSFHTFVCGFVRLRNKFMLLRRQLLFSQPRILGRFDTDSDDTRREKWPWLLKSQYF